jgi:hypothetical protein
MAQTAISRTASRSKPIDITLMKVHSTELELFAAADADDSYALRVAGEKAWRARTGFGSGLEHVWTVEVESSIEPELAEVDWDAVLERAIEAFEMSDPVISNFDWPVGHHDTH